MFAEPWQAQAFALAVSFQRKGISPGKNGPPLLADELHAAARRGEPDDGSRYYEHWLSALESLVTAKGLADPTALLTRRRLGPLPTETLPHGQPVELLQPQAPEARWLLLGLACTFATYSISQQASVEPMMGERIIWTGWNVSDQGSELPFGIRCERRSGHPARHAARA